PGDAPPLQPGDGGHLRGDARRAHAHPRAGRHRHQRLRMSEDYRDPLAAAHARIADLERENAELRSKSSGRPATADEVEALRVEQELMRLEMKWQAKARQYGGSFDPARHRTTLRFLYGLAIGFVVLGIVLGVLVAKAALVVILMFSFLGILMAALGAL